MKLRPKELDHNESRFYFLSLFNGKPLVSGVYRMGKHRELEKKEEENMPGDGTLFCYGRAQRPDADVYF